MSTAYHCITLFPNEPIRLDALTDSLYHHLLDVGTSMPGAEKCFVQDEEFGCVGQYDKRDTNDPPYFRVRFTGKGAENESDSSTSFALEHWGAISNDRFSEAVGRLKDSH